ncbi:phosphotransferase family protein [Paenibacillus allorhizosphaerae]|uniref:Aminoglycoside phosphotransferase domain-containing protein n=1 Tax=Paenibacillus allorhizosphaerae TaxID=2849866 RepID=A0ABM8VJX9_9BACL|nr:aminoglycoside phosphotransferase family protein [Paenibacillus allorhizosphaerae]CAG7646227.1 hypothetical protein PAECIP111802_03693 [Paenibacillus allorhizosphaerae]
MHDKYMSRIKEVYPDLTIDDYVVNDIGQNNDVFIINQSLVFRFPKYEAGIVAMKKEQKILECIQNIVSLPIPFPLYESFEEGEVGKVFTGYALIPGVPLWKESLAGVKDEDSIKGLAMQLVTFLTELHSASGEIVNEFLQPVDQGPHEEMSALFRNIQNKLFPYMRKDAQTKVSEWFEAFLSSETSLGIQTALIHGDFGASNIIWRPDIGSLSGIIDFGGSGWGDPAYDFAGIWSSYGEAFYEMCIHLYPDGSDISKRVKFYKSTFALQEALHGIENNDRQAFEAGIQDYR